MRFVAFITVVLLATSAVAAEKPNVLFIAIDDLRTELGCYGETHVPSPNLDKLASEGALFLNHYVHVPTCGASRYSLLTGRHPSESGAKSGNGHFYNGAAKLSQDTTPGAQTMPELFRRNGYYTVNIGKISHTADGRVYEYNGKGDGRDEMPGAWDELATPFGQWKRGWGVFFAYANGVHREDGSGAQDLMQFTVENDDDLPDGLNATVAIEKLRELKDRDEPFFMGLGFYKPHLPFVAPKQDWNAVKVIAAPDAPHPEYHESAHKNEKSGEFYKYDTPYEKSYPLDHDARMMARRAYWACVRYADRQVGRVLDELETLGLADNTIVVVWGDHGWNLGDGAQWAKHVAHERALKSALIVRAPGVSQSGLRTEALAQTTDLYPTLIDLCGLENTRTEYPLFGKTLRPVLSGDAPAVHETVTGYWRNAESIRDARYRLITTRTDGRFANTELYDLAAGPDPVTNIAADHPEIVQKLLSQLP